MFLITFNFTSIYYLQKCCSVPYIHNKNLLYKYTGKLEIENGIFNCTPARIKKVRFNYARYNNVYERLGKKSEESGIVLACISDYSNQKQ